MQLELLPPKRTLSLLSISATTSKVLLTPEKEHPSPPDQPHKEGKTRPRGGPPKFSPFTMPLFSRCSKPYLSSQTLQSACIVRCHLEGTVRLAACLCLLRSSRFQQGCRCLPSWLFMSISLLNISHGHRIFALFVVCHCFLFFDYFVSSSDRYMLS